MSFKTGGTQLMYYSTVWLMPEQLNLKRKHHLYQECKWLWLKRQQLEDAACLRQSAVALIPMGICRGKEGRHENRGPVLKCSFSGWISNPLFPH